VFALPCDSSPALNLVQASLAKGLRQNLRQQQAKPRRRAVFLLFRGTHDYSRKRLSGQRLAPQTKPFPGLDPRPESVDNLRPGTLSQASTSAKEQ
jgi:hypothetical protein